MSPSRPRRPGRHSSAFRLLLSLSAALGSAMLVAIAVAVADLDLTGHGRAPLNRALLDWPAGGVHLGVGDVLLLGTAALSAAVVWLRTGGGGTHPR